MSQFDEVIDRRGSGSVRWDSLLEKYGDEAVLPLTTADMGFRAPEAVREALIRAAEFGIFGYTRPKQSYYEALMERFQNKYHWPVRQEWISYSPGIVGGVAFCIQGMTKPEDAVLLLTPMYHPFSHLIEDNGRRLISTKLLQNKTGAEIDFEQLEKDIAEHQVKMMIFCNPHNPIGRAWKEAEIREVCALCLQYKVLLVTDEIHADFVYEGHQFVSAGTVMEKLGGLNSLIVCSSGSKTYNIAGLQCSNVIIPDQELRKQYTAILQKQHYMELNALGPVAAEAAYRYGEEWQQELLAYLQGNRDYLAAAVNETIPGIHAIVPEATYMMWLDCRELGMTDAKLQEFLVKEAKLGLNPGNSFGPGGEGYVRINFAEPRSVIEEAVRRLVSAVRKRQTEGRQV